MKYHHTEATSFLILYQRQIPKFEFTPHENTETQASNDLNGGLQRNRMCLQLSQQSNNPTTCETSTSAYPEKKPYKSK